MTTSPMNTTRQVNVDRHPATDERPGRDGRRRHPADEPVRERALLALVVRGDEGRDRRDDQNGTQPLDQRPAEQQDRQVG